jgi:hypothetical protein
MIINQWISSRGEYKICFFILIHPRRNKANDDYEILKPVAPRQPKVLFFMGKNEDERGIKRIRKTALSIKSHCNNNP